MVRAVTKGVGNSLLLNWVFLSASSLIVSFALVAGLTLNGFTRQQAQDAEYLNALNVSRELSERIFTYFQQIEVTSLSLAAIVSSNPDLTQDEFSVYAQRLVETLPEVQNVAAAPGNTVRFVYPVDPNRSVIGLDYRNDPAALAAIERSRMTRRPQLQGPISLVQGGQGFVTRTPVYVREENSNTETYWGVIALVYSTQGLFDAIQISSGFEEWQIGISRVDARTDLGQLIFGTVSRQSDLAVREYASGLGTDWEVAVLPARGHWTMTAPGAMETWTILAGVALLLILVLHTFMSLFRGREVAQQRLQQAIGSLEDGFALFDQNDRLVLCNDKYREIYKLSADQFVPGKRFEDIVRIAVARGEFPEAKGREEEWISERLTAHREASSVIEQQVADGRWLKIAESKTPDGCTVGFRVDITELKQSLEKAEEANRAKSEFLQVVSHELRTPLTAVIGYLSFLAKPELLPATKAFRAGLADDSTTREALAQLNETQLQSLAGFATRAQVSGDHLLRLIGDVLVWSKLERHEVVLDVKTMTTFDLVERLNAQVEELARARDVDFKVDAEDLTLSADPDRLTQAVLNLVSNAIKFSGEGDVTLRIEQTGTEALFRVQDSGPGIPEDLQEKIFDRFFQADTTKTRAQGGVGLGLSIALQLVKLHGGRIEVNSAPGQGAEFIIVLPLSQTVRQAA